MSFTLNPTLNTQTTMKSVLVDFEDAQALAQLVEENLQYEIETDHALWASLLKRLNEALEIASE
jgi:hypothetical protein